MSSALPVVLLHGARTSRTMWRTQLEALDRAGRTAVAPDLPGHGRRLDETFTVDAALAAVDEAVQEVGGRAVVVGLSLGGYLGTAWAARNPGGAAALLLSGCSTDADTVLTGAWLQAARLIGRLPDRGSALNQALVDRALPPEGAADVAAGGFALEVMVDLLGAMRTLDPRADLARVTCPVWFANGQWDHFRLHERAFLAARPGARRVVVRGATHLASLVRPVAFTRVLLELLEEVDPPAVRLSAPR
jgi:pimeloyl-ACP methyl ester carboxylesterase